MIITIHQPNRLINKHIKFEFDITNIGEKESESEIEHTENPVH